jgi:16S rRNA (cytosine1402-N4)-methyltransferase
MEIATNVVFVNGTVGGEGHANALLHQLQPGDVVFGCDVDADALRSTCQRLEQCRSTSDRSSVVPGSDAPTAQRKPTFIPVQSNFCDLSVPKLIQAARTASGVALEKHVQQLLLPIVRGGVDGIILDLDVSLYQIDTADRGFAYRQNGPLDMQLSNSNSTSASSSTLIQSRSG